MTEPEFARAEMGLFLGVFGIALSLYFSFPTLSVVGRVLVAVGVMVFGIPAIGLMAPRVNRLVEFLVHPHRPAEYVQILGRATRTSSDVGRPALVRTVIVVLLVGIGYLLLQVLPAQARQVRCRSAETLIGRSELLTREAEDLALRQPDLGLLVALHGAAVFPEDARLAECGLRSPGTSGGLIEIISSVAPVETQIQFDSPASAIAANEATGLAAAGLQDGTILLWAGGGDVVVVESWRAHDEPIRTLAMSPDGEVLVSATVSGSVRIWGTRDRTLIRALDDAHDGEIRAISFADDGLSFATTGDDGWVRRWTAGAAPTLFGRLGDGTSRLFAVSLSRRGDEVAWAEGNTLVVQRDGRSPIRIATGHRGSIRNVDHSPRDGSVLTTGDEGTIRLWDTSTREVVVTLEGHRGSVRSAHFSADGSHLISVGADDRLLLWDLNLRPPAIVTEILAPGPTADAVFLGEGFIGGVPARDAASVTVWNVVGDQPLADRLAIETGPVTAVATSSGSLVVGDAHGDLVLVDLAHGTPLARVDGHAAAVRSVTIDPAGRVLASAGDDGVVMLWGASDLAELGTVGPELGALRSVSFDRRGELLAVAGEEGIVVVDVDDGRVVEGPLRDHGGVVRAVAFSPSESSFVSGGDDGRVLLWSTGSTRPESTPLHHTDRVWAVGFDPSGTRVVSAGADGVIALWDMATGAVLESTESSDQVWSVAFSDDGGLVAAGVGRDLALWSGLEAELLGESLPAHLDIVRAVDFVGDDPIVVSGGADSVVFVWDLTLDRLVVRACRIAGRNMSQAEWDRFADGAYRRHCVDHPPSRDAPETAEAVDY